VSEAAAVEAARVHGVAVDAGRRYFPAEPAGAFLRIGFAATEDAGRLTEAARRLGRAAHDCEPPAS
jgi:DNA-binding transcriptional MocR family regulator